MKRIYASAISPNGKRVRICAAELGLEVHPELLDMQKGENRTADYLALNPMGKVPTMVDGDFVLWESAAILWNLASTHPKGDTLLPRDPRGQADALRWLFFCSCHLDPYFTTLVVERFVKPRRKEAADDAAATGAEQWLTRFIPVVEQQLSTGDYVTGRFGLPDIALGCTIELSPMLKYDLGERPNIRAWLDRLHARASWKGSSPEAFPRDAA
jgi:glutathione S-transferase